MQRKTCRIFSLNSPVVYYLLERIAAMVYGVNNIFHNIETINTYLPKLETIYKINYLPRRHKGTENIMGVY